MIPPSQAAPTGLPELTNAQWRERNDRVMTPQYGARRLAIVRGEGSRVWDAEGKCYLDYLTGISVNNLGHCHPRVTEAIQRQAATLVHCTNLYYIPVQIQLAERLVELSFADRVFFCNSGAEANEAAIKIARRCQKERHGEARSDIICFQNSFHGRTLATLTATGQEKVKTHFEPLMPGFKHAPLNDLSAVEALIDERTGAIMVEPIQGEGGIHACHEEFLRGLRRLCDERGLLLIFDEIQTGLGRAGALFAYQRYGIEPDIMTLAKSLGGGIATGAMLCRASVAEAFGLGSHGTTMGGNALASAAALAYVNELVEGDWPAKSAENGDYLLTRLAGALEATHSVRELRGVGMMIGIELDGPVAEVLKACEEQGLIPGSAGPNVIRLLPPLNTTREEIEEAVGILARAILEHERS